MSNYATYEIESELREKGYEYIVGVDEVGRGCERPDAEILTDSGWKHYTNLSPSDKVLSYTDMDTMVWQNIDTIIEKDFKGYLLDLSNRSVHIVVTPDHCFDTLRRVFKRDIQDGNKLKLVGFKFNRRKNVLDLLNNDYIPRGGCWVGKEIDFFTLPATTKKKWDHSGKDYSEKLIPMRDWLAFLGIFLSEGSTTKSRNGAYIVKISQKKKEFYNKIYNMCIKLPFDVYKDKNGVTIYNKQLYDYLSPLGKCYDKYIPNEFKDLSPQLLNILIDWMIMGDGSCYTSKNRQEVCSYYTTSSKLRDDFEEILLKAGWTYHTSSRKPRDGKIRDRVIKKENCVICFETRLRRNNKIHVKYLSKKNIFYDGKVFCLQLLKHHNFYVRRDGTGYFTGNCCAGPVVAAACYIPESVLPELLYRVKDSKKLSEKKREELFPLIRSTCKIGIGVVSNTVIDDINILNATKVAMEEALGHLTKIDYVIIDGTVVLPNLSLPQKQIIKGDLKSISIASASVVAKVVRDRIMLDLHDIWGFYGWDKNKGYGTKTHIEALRTYGPCEVHRLTFNKVL